MESLYWFFIIAVVIATFFVIFKKLSRFSYWTMAIIAVLYIGALLISYFLEF